MSTVQTTFRYVSPTPAINYQVDRHFNKLKKAYTKINKCSVVIDLARNSIHKNRLYRVCINLTIPGKELISKKQDPNLFNALRNGFSTLEQLLEKHHKKKLLFKKSYPNYPSDFKNDSMVRVS